MTESARCLIIKLHDENEMYIGTYDGGNRNDITFNARSLSSTPSCVLIAISKTLEERSRSSFAATLSSSSSDKLRLDPPPGDVVAYGMQGI